MSELSEMIKLYNKVNAENAELRARAERAEAERDEARADAAALRAAGERLHEYLLDLKNFQGDIPDEIYEPFDRALAGKGKP